MSTNAKVKDVNIMIVDDSTMMRTIINRIASNLPNMKIVAEASNGLQALAFFNDRKPNLITMDLVMPSMDGVETIKKLDASHKAALEKNGTKILVISSLNDPDRAMDALEAGAHAFLQKPFSEAELLKAISDLGFQV